MQLAWRTLLKEPRPALTRGWQTRGPPPQYLIFLTRALFAGYVAAASRSVASMFEEELEVAIKVRVVSSLKTQITQWQMEILVKIFHKIVMLHLCMGNYILHEAHSIFCEA